MKLLPRNIRLKMVAGELAPNVNILNELIGSTENDFLFIGAKLQDFHQQANSVSGMTTQASRYLASKEMDAIIENFKIVLDMADNLHGGFASEKDALGLIITSFSQIHSPLATFEKIVRNLNILCNFIKIEIARLGRSDTGFNTLADDVRRLASVIETEKINLIDKADSLTPLLTENLSFVENLGSDNESQAKIILQNIIGDIRTLTEKTNTSKDSLEDVTAKWEEISANMAAVVESIQIHDITRQRFEHAREALSELPQRICDHRKERSGWQRLHRLLKNNPVTGNRTSQGGIGEADLIADICELERAQLQNARDGFVIAVEHILTNLENIARHSSSMSTDLHEITDGSKDRKGSFISGLEQDIDYLESCINECMKLNRDLAAAMLKVAQTASGMAIFMKEMEKISIEMQMLALNARVHAAHVGDEGATLGVLADSIHQLAVETAIQVGSISSSLKDVVANSEKLAIKADQDNLIVQDKAAAIKEYLEQIIEPVKKIDDEINSLMPRIDQAGRILAEDIGQLTSHVTIHHRVDQNIKNIVVSLDNISAKVKADKVTDSSRSGTKHLDDLTKRYTMQTERDTHLNAAKPAASELRLITAESLADPSAAAGSSGEAASDDLGDNVELF